MSTTEEEVVRASDEDVVNGDKKKTRSFKVKLTQTDPAYGRYNGDTDLMPRPTQSRGPVTTRRSGLWRTRVLTHERRANHHLAEKA